MRRQHKKQIEFTSVLRSFLSEFFTVFFVITFNGTILVSMLATLLRKEVSVYEIGILKTYVEVSSVSFVFYVMSS